MLLALLITLWTASNSLADEQVSAVILPDREELTVGDVVHMTLQVTHPAGYQLLPVQPGESWGDFEIRNITPINVIGHDDGSETSSQIIDVTLWAPGTYTTPPLTITVSDTAGETQEIEVEPVSVTVNSVLIEGDEELRDLKPQASLPVPPVWPWVLAGLLLVILGGGLLRRWLQRRRATARQDLAGVPDLRPAYQIALDELARIEQLDLPARGRFKTHYTLVADALRRYLESGYHVPAMDRTTSEIQRALKPMTLAAAHKSKLIDLLTEADLVKFAKVIPEMSLAKQYPDQARQFVLITRPLPEAPSPNGETKGLSGAAI